MSKKLMVAVAVVLVGVAGMVIAQQNYPNVDDPPVVLDNDHVVVQKLTRVAGSWVGMHKHAGNQLVVILEDSTMIYKVGGEEKEMSYKKGDVFWVDAVEHDHMAKSAGDAIIVTLK